MISFWIWGYQPVQPNYVLALSGNTPSFHMPQPLLETRLFQLLFCVFKIWGFSVFAASRVCSSVVQGHSRFSGSGVCCELRQSWAPLQTLHTISIRPDPKGPPPRARAESGLPAGGVFVGGVESTRASERGERFVGMGVQCDECT